MSTIATTPYSLGKSNLDNITETINDTPCASILSPNFQINPEKILSFNPFFISSISY